MLCLIRLLNRLSEDIRLVFGETNDMFMRISFLFIYASLSKIVNTSCINLLFRISIFSILNS